MNYHVIEKPVLAEFVKEVRTFLKAGWQLHGATQVVVSGHGNGVKTYVQAIIQEEKDEVATGK